ncbi:MAG: adenylyltransferase/cytidyltransferase family protein [Anaerohalosphaera sp.]|nr:adenylyltransferase/cytidyltransferase family protein [Anaerohalosphaera sp.]
MTKTIVTAGAFDIPEAGSLRFLHEISQQGQVKLLLFDDALIESLTGAMPKFPLAERQYYLESVRFVNRVHVISDVAQLSDAASVVGCNVGLWFSLLPDNFENYASDQSIPHQFISDEQLVGFPEDIPLAASGNKKVIVTGCFDWFHSGHVRFLEEASEYGDLYVVVGHDKNIKALKGPGHPMFTQDQRKFIIGSIRFVTRSLISSGDGWLDAEPEIMQVKPDIYLVNEDGDRGEKRQYCQDNDIEYIVLKREPKPGLTRRTSTDLRGF